MEPEHDHFQVRRSPIPKGSMFVFGGVSHHFFGASLPRNPVRCQTYVLSVSSRGFKVSSKKPRKRELIAVFFVPDF